MFYPVYVVMANLENGRTVEASLPNSLHDSLVRAPIGIYSAEPFGRSATLNAETGATNDACSAQATRAGCFRNSRSRIPRRFGVWGTSLRTPPISFQSPRISE